MKSTFFILTGLILVFFACKNSNTGTTDIAGQADTPGTETSSIANEGKDMAMDSAGMMKAWADYATPGEMHQLLASWNGRWNGEVLTWMDPATPPSKSQATNMLSSVLGGLYQAGHMSGIMMGMPFEGNSLIGYDNAKKLFVSTWVDNMGTGITHMTGTWDAGSKTLNMKGFQTDPVSGQDSHIREVLQVVDDNTHIMTMYGDGMDGKEMKFMEATFKRN